MDINAGNTIKAYSTEELISELQRRGLTDTIIINEASTNYYISVPALNKEIKGCTNWANKEKAIITVTKIN